MPKTAPKKLKVILKKHGFEICVLYFIILIFSFGFYERNTHGWSSSYAGFKSGQTYFVEAEQLSFGVPIPWMHFNTIVTVGSPPPLSELRGIQKYLHPINIDF